MYAYMCVGIGCVVNIQFPVLKRQTNYRRQHNMVNVMLIKLTNPLDVIIFRLGTSANKVNQSLEIGQQSPPFVEDIKAFATNARRMSSGNVNTIHRNVCPKIFSIQQLLNNTFIKKKNLIKIIILFEKKFSKILVLSFDIFFHFVIGNVAPSDKW